MLKRIKDCTVLNNGLEMPWLGFGVYQIKDGEQVESSVCAAVEIGYRSIDTAAIYKNERGVGNALRTCGIPREDIFLTTKVWNTDMRLERTLEAFDESLEKLGTDYVDLYLIHWPVEGGYKKAWKALEEIYHSGRAKAIGVSNFMVHHLEDLLSECKIVPAVNQVEFHPYLLQPELLQFCQDHGIQMEAWSPLMAGRIVQDASVQKIAEKYGKTAAQVTLRWDLQHGVVTIPKSVHRNRIEENSQIFDFELSEQEMSELDSLDKNKRVGPDPDNFDF